jgi:hypothetical protein
MRRAVVLSGEERAAMHERYIGDDSERFDGAEGFWYVLVLRLASPWLALAMHLSFCLITLLVLY